MNTSDSVVVSVDELELAAAVSLVQKIGVRVYAVKIHDLFDRHGAQAIQKLKEAGAPRVWVDAKLYDIPNTARARAHAIALSGADIITVHASGGVEMMRTAKEGAGNAEVYAVTVLTSFSPEGAEAIYGANPTEVVLRLARLAQEAGVDGVVCSPQEVEMLKAEFPTLKLVVPGIRSSGKDVHDQKRTGTPLATLTAGASVLVIGRQITTAPVPEEALDDIQEELQAS